MQFRVQRGANKKKLMRKKMRKNEKEKERKKEKNIYVIKKKKYEYKVNSPVL
jgi:hypothetical protein